jgi:phospholipid/cholesterol/gamma-HCH transport system substrate-binding protein
MIESANSDFDVLLASLPEVVARAATLIDHVDQVFSEKNVAAVSQTLESLRATTQGLPKTAARVAQLVDQLQVTLTEVSGAAAEIRGLAQDSRPDVKQALQRLNVAADNLSAATGHVNKFLANSEAQMGHLTEQGFFELERLLRDTRSAANEFRDLSRSLKQQPSQLMYEKPNAGMEISR